MRELPSLRQLRRMRHSRPGFSQPEPVGAFPSDESPYGVRDVVGGMRQWVGDRFGVLDARSALAEPEPVRTTMREHGGMRTSRGGSWIPTRRIVVARGIDFALFRSPYLGMRIAVSLTRCTTSRRLSVPLPSVAAFLDMDVEGQSCARRNRRCLPPCRV